MKYIPCILLFLLLLPPLWLLIRQRIAYHKTKAMPPGQKLALLKELLSPFGYCYLPIQDAISTTNDAWQKEAGYTALYDRNVQRSQSLTTQITLTFPNHSMEQTFFRALLQSSLPRECYYVRGNRVHIQFGAIYDLSSGKNHPLLYRIHVLIVQAQNRITCGLFNLLTRPFTDTMDKILYLYALLPFTIRLFLRGLKNLHRL